MVVVSMFVVSSERMLFMVLNYMKKCQEMMAKLFIQNMFNN